MYKSTKINWKKLIICLLSGWLVAGLSALFTKDSMEIYGQLKQPPLSPPGVVFPIVWGILFTLMGISAYIVASSESNAKKPALWVYGIQLVLNFCWSLIFFNMQAYWFAFWWLLVLWLAIIAMIVLFYRVKPIAAYLQIPYFLWVTFAAYLNLMIAILN